MTPKNMGGGIYNSEKKKREENNKIETSKRELIKIKYIW